MIEMTEAAMLEGLAEEASELAHAALKLARIFRDENPTPVQAAEAKEKLTEEMADVVLYSQVVRERIGVRLDKINEVVLRKQDRWKRRMSEGV